MSIRVRLILLVLLVAVVPTLLAIFSTTSYMETLAISSGQAALAKIGEAAIHDQALTTAQQVESYLRNHPEIDLSDLTALEANQELATLAVQPVGKTGYTAVFDADGITHFHVNPGIVGTDMSTFADTLPEFWAIFAASLGGSPSNGYYDWQDADGSIRQKYMAIVPVGDSQLLVAATTYMEEFSEPAQMITAELEQVTSLTRRRFVLSVVIAGVAALGLGILVSIRLTAPLQEMTEAATRVMQGEWDAVQPSHRRDELGILNRALSAMTLRLQELVQNLEQQVEARTADLELRTRYLEATAKVARDVTSELDPQKLLTQVIELISERFGFDRAGIFLLDPSGEWAVLRAASSEGGQRTLARDFRLRVGDEGIVGYVTGTGKPYMAPDVTEDPIFLYDPDIGDTRSEMALPLRARGEIIGALDVQSLEVAAFSEEDVAVLQMLADQIALALSNARLYQQAQESLKAERRAYGELTREAWRQLLAAQSNLGFLRDRQGVSPASDVLQPTTEKALQTGKTERDKDGKMSLAMPLKVRDHVIGVIDARKPDGAGEWTPEEVTLLETLGDQLALALESARLYQDTQRRAARERLTSEVTARMRETLDVDTVLKTAVGEVRQALDLPEVVIRLMPRPEEEKVRVGGGKEPVPPARLARARDGSQGNDQEVFP